MNGALTQYKIGSNFYSSYVLGDTIEEISLKIKARNLGETLVSGVVKVNTIEDFSNMEDKELISKYPEFMHTVCFISYLGYKAGKIKAEEILDDEGLLHEILHINQERTFRKKDLEDSKEIFQKIKSKVVGVF